MKVCAFRLFAVGLAVAFLISISIHSSNTLLLSNEQLAIASSVLEKGVKPYDQPAEAEEFYRLKRAPNGRSAIPVERYLKAAERVKRMPQYNTSSDTFLPPLNAMRPAAAEAMALDSWTQLGPGNVGGRTRALLINPNNPDIMYAAGVAGGVWKSTNAGGSWTALNDLLPNLAVSSMAFETGNPNTIYAGTGEGYFNSDAVRGAGIFKTTDAGATWGYLLSTATPDFHFVNDIVVSPNNNQRVYAATRTGVWLSNDGGESWTLTLRPLGDTGSVVRGGCVDLVIRTDQATDYLFASCGNFVQATVYRNTDAGGAGTWAPVLSEPGMGRISLAIASSNQSIVYALAASIDEGDFRNGLLAVFRSGSNGDAGTWTARVRNTSPTRLNTVLLTNAVLAFSNECSNRTNQFLNQGWYDNCIAVDPVDPDRVWAGGIDLFRSDDGGANWGLASYWWANKSVPQFVHADQHIIVFHPQYDGVNNKTMFVGNDGGIYRTNDARAATATSSRAPCNPSNSGLVWTSLNNNYGVTQFYYGLPHPNGATYFGGTQDNGTLQGSDGRGIGGWTEIFGGDGGYVALDPTNVDNLYVETTRLSIRRSTDGGQTFASATGGIAESANNFLFINPFIMDPSVPQRLWTGGRAMWRTSDAASSWTQASANFPEASVSAVAVASTNSNSVLAGTSGGFIHRTNIGLTSNSSTVWPSARPRSGFVSWLSFDPTNANIAYATYSTFGGGPHVWKSTDAGATWAGIDGSGDTAIPDIPVHTIVVDPTNPLKLYVGTDLGVFVSVDGGANWARENTGFANVITESLAVGSIGNSTVLFAFTHGRGVWRVTLGPATLKVTSASVVGKKLLVVGQRFDDGAQILVNGQQQSTKADGRSPTTNLIAKRGGKRVKPGETVTIQVQNSDGTTSPAFSYTRP